MDDVVSFAIAEWLKKARKKSGLKQEELAKKSGMSKAYVGHLENARPHNLTGARPSPSAEIIESLAKAMNADVNEALLLAGFAPKNIAPMNENFQAMSLKFDQLPPTKQERAAELVKFLDEYLDKLERESD